MTPELWERLARAETHATRLALLEQLAGGAEFSNAALCDRLESTTAHINYHLGVLEGRGLIELTRTEQEGPETHAYFRMAAGVLA